MPRNWAWGKHRKSGYRSGLEEKFAASLEEKGIPFKYESERLIYSKPVRKGKCTECGATKVVKLATYTPDFVLDNGTMVECKGRLTATDRSKLLAVRASNPTLKLVLYFSIDNKLQKNGTKRYSDWAAEHDFDFSIGTLPRRWLRGCSSGRVDNGGNKSSI